MVLDPNSYLDLHNQFMKMNSLQSQQPGAAKGKVPYTKESLKAIRNLENQFYHLLSPSVKAPKKQKTFKIRGYYRFLEQKAKLAELESSTQKQASEMSSKVI